MFVLQLGGLVDLGDPFRPVLLASSSMGLRCLVSAGPPPELWRGGVGRSPMRLCSSSSFVVLMVLLSWVIPSGPGSLASSSVGLQGSRARCLSAPLLGSGGVGWVTPPTTWAQCPEVALSSLP